MTDYARGLGKLGFSIAGDPRKWPSDLRTEPAFAWRVLDALLARFDAEDVWFGQCTEGRFCVIGAPEEYHEAGYEPEADVDGVTLADALYAAVEKLGREAK